MEKNDDLYFPYILEEILQDNRSVLKVEKNDYEIIK